MKVLIGIGGKKRSGKSTLANFLMKEAALKGWDSEIVSFADPIKFMMQEVFRYEVSHNTFLDDLRKQDPIKIAPDCTLTVREILQKVGTECFRDIIHKDFWIHRGMAKIDSSSANVVIVPDVRFGNELEALKKKIGVTVYIERPDLSDVVDKHPSEMELEEIKNDFDIQWVNWRDEIEDLRYFAHDLIKRVW